MIKCFLRFQYQTNTSTDIAQKLQTLQQRKLKKRIKFTGPNISTFHLFLKPRTACYYIRTHTPYIKFYSDNHVLQLCSALSFFNILCFIVVKCVVQCDCIYTQLNFAVSADSIAHSLLVLSCIKFLPCIPVCCCIQLDKFSQQTTWRSPYTYQTTGSSSCSTFLNNQEKQEVHLR